MRTFCAHILRVNSGRLVVRRCDKTAMLWCIRMEKRRLANISPASRDACNFRVDYIFAAQTMHELLHLAWLSGV